MRALTIQQPYAHLIMTPQEELPEGVFHKRVENRTWDTKVRGTVAIHAGASMNMFNNGDYPYRGGKKPKASDYPEMAFGAILGMVEIVEVFHLKQIRDVDLPDDYEWLIDHEHTHGPYCFVLKNPQRLRNPIACCGMLGFWTVPEDVVEVMGTLI